MRAPRRCLSAFRPRKRLPAGPTWPPRRHGPASPPSCAVSGSGCGHPPRASADELDPAPHPRAWAQASVSARECVGAARCPYGNECFAERARARAREADIIVTNHALLALDLLAPAAILPDHDAVIVDEAHELADRVTDAATDGLTPAGLSLAARRVAPLVSEDLARAFDEAVSALTSALAAAAPGRFERLPTELSGALLRLRTAGANATGAIQPDAEDPAQLRSRRLAESAVDTAARILAMSPADVVWVEVDERGAHVLKVAPLEVAGRLAAQLFSRCPVVATSATLAIGGTFDLIADQFGLSKQARIPAEAGPGGRAAVRTDRGDAAGADETQAAGEPQPGSWVGLDVGSPFDYSRQAILYVARHLPPPGRSGTDPALLDELSALIQAAGGRTLGLFFVGPGRAGGRRGDPGPDVAAGPGARRRGNGRPRRPVPRRTAHVPVRHVVAVARGGCTRPVLPVGHRRPHPVPPARMTP